MRENDLLAGDILETPKEGALLPDTYKFPRGFPRTRLIAKMQEDQRRLLAQIWEKRAPDLPLRTPFELLTLASIVEKETGKAEERPRVAAVFVNRLRKHMRLQSGEAFCAPKSRNGRPTTPTPSTGCRPDRSPIPAAPRLKLRPIPHQPTTFISSLTAQGAMSSPARLANIRAMSSNGAGSRRKRKTGPIRPPIAPRLAPSRRLRPETTNARRRRSDG
jgi:hypothetical protein